MSELMDNSSVAVVAVGHYGRRNERPTCHESRAIKGYPKMLKLGVDKINYSLADFMYCQEFCLFNFCPPGSFNLVLPQLPFEHKAVCFIKSDSDFCLLYDKCVRLDMTFTDDWALKVKSLINWSLIDIARTITQQSIEIYVKFPLMVLSLNHGLGSNIQQKFQDTEFMRNIKF